MYRGKDVVIMLPLRVCVLDTHCRCKEFHHNKFVRAEYKSPGIGYGTTRKEAIENLIRKAKYVAYKQKRKKS